MSETEKSKKIELNEVMLAMDVVDTLRHQQSVVERELGTDDHELDDHENRQNQEHRPARRLVHRLEVGADLDEREQRQPALHLPAESGGMRSPRVPPEGRAIPDHQQRAGGPRTPPVPRLQLLMKVEVTRYRKPDGYATRYWAVIVDGELLAVTVYRKGAEAVARALTTDPVSCHVQDHDPTPNEGTIRYHATAGLATDRPR